MIVEPINHGLVIRYERRNGTHRIKQFSRAYDYGQTSLGHSWLPINIILDPSRRHLFCTFAGFHPRLLPMHVAAAYAGRIANPATIRYVPSLLMRFDANTLEPEYDGSRSYRWTTSPLQFRGRSCTL